MCLEADYLAVLRRGVKASQMPPFVILRLFPQLTYLLLLDLKVLLLNPYLSAQLNAASSLPFAKTTVISPGHGCWALATIQGGRLWIESAGGIEPPPCAVNSWQEALRFTLKSFRYPDSLLPCKAIIKLRISMEAGSTFPMGWASQVKGSLYPHLSALWCLVSTVVLFALTCCLALHCFSLCLLARLPFICHSSLSYLVCLPLLDTLPLGLLSDLLCYHLALIHLTFANEHPLYHICFFLTLYFAGLAVCPSFLACWLRSSSVPLASVGGEKWRAALRALHNLEAPFAPLFRALPLLGVNWDSGSPGHLRRSVDWYIYIYIYIFLFIFIYIFFQYAL